jgi:hypothetical protein
MARRGFNCFLVIWIIVVRIISVRILLNSYRFWSVVRWLVFFISESGLANTDGIAGTKPAR